ncbi:hypothetical protein [Candidatus Aalborgicola defluviihabitans]|uniref:hypothetical protein n=1 Tax=Candidatus Aalborgicola defluviihabitans TaxID=3386187 RepID=UPI0039B8AF85
MKALAPFDAADYLDDEATTTQYITAALEASNTDVFLNAVLKLLHALGVKLSASPIYS